MNPRPADAALAALAAAALLTAACSSGPSAPSWCAPLITQLHAHESGQKYLDGLTALEKQGAPVAQLVKDDTAYRNDQATANTTGTGSFTALADEPKAIAKVGDDLKTLNAACGQPAGAYKSDNV